MMSISSLLSDSPIANNSRSLSRASSSSPPSFHLQFQKFKPTTRPILSTTNSNNSAFNTSPNLSESSNDEQNGIIHQNFVNGFQTYDNSDIIINNNFNQKMHLQTAQILHHNLTSSPSTNSSNSHFDNLIPPLILDNNNSQSSMNKNNQNSIDSNKSTNSAAFDLILPDPTYYDKDGMKYGIRCVCGDPRDDGFLVQCEKCEMWLHGSCINYTRNANGDHYYCPFCLKTKIQCVCGKSMKYDLPLIHCKKCGHWSHKPCENIEFGRIPLNFICSNCRKLDKTGNEPSNKVFYDIPYVKFSENDKDVIDITVFTESNHTGSSFDKSSIANSLPDGPFRTMIEEDLNTPEIKFRSFMEKYFHTFAPLFFDRIHEFFRVFNETVCAIFKINKKSVLRALDVLANRLLYDQFQTGNIKSEDNNNENKNVIISNDQNGDDNEEEEDFNHSESITDYLADMQTLHLEELPNAVELYTDSKRARENFDSSISNKKNRRKRKKTENEGNDETKTYLAINDYLAPCDLDSKGGVYTSTALEDGSFITEIPGFLIHSDEINADSGIPSTSILITDDVLFIDTLGTPFERFSRQFKRSFHFNCIVKLIRVKESHRAALYATRLQGPLSEEKTRRGDAIPANSELILPFDGDIPFPTEKIEWKERRRRKFNFNSNNANFNNTKDNFCKIDNDFTNKSLTNIDLTKSFNNNNIGNNNQDFDINSELNEKMNDTLHKEVIKKTKKKITQQTVAKRCVIDPNLTLLSTFMDSYVPPMPFIVLSDEEDIDVYKTQMERIKTRILSQ